MDRGVVMKNEDIKKMITDLTNDTKKIKNALSQLETDAAVLQTGDANGPYWNGSNALHTVKSCLSNIETDKEILKNLEKTIGYLETLIK